MNVVVGGLALSELPSVDGSDRFTMVHLDEEELRRELAAGAEEAVLVTPSPARAGECQELGFALYERSPGATVTVVHPQTAPAAADLLRWCRNARIFRDRRRAEVILPLAAGGVSPAHTRQVIAEYIGGSLDEPTVASATLAISELVSNALQHAGDGIVELQLFDNGVHLDVLDHVPHRWPISASNRDPLADAGRGLAIVAAVTTVWGVSANADAKSVWCELHDVSPVPLAAS